MPFFGAAADAAEKENFMAFFNSAVGVLQTLVIALGAGLGIWGFTNLMESYGNDNPGAKAWALFLRLPMPSTCFITQLFPCLIVPSQIWHPSVIFRFLLSLPNIKISVLFLPPALHSKELPGDRLVKTYKSLLLFLRLWLHILLENPALSFHLPRCL